MKNSASVEIDAAFFHKVEGLPETVAATYNHGEICYTVDAGVDVTAYATELALKAGDIAEVGFVGYGRGEFEMCVVVVPQAPGMRVDTILESLRLVATPLACGAVGPAPSYALQTQGMFRAPEVAKVSFKLQLNRLGSGECHISNGTLTARVINRDPDKCAGCPLTLVNCRARTEDAADIH